MKTVLSKPLTASNSGELVIEKTFPEEATTNSFLKNTGLQNQHLRVDSASLKQRLFCRREVLPIEKNILWRIEKGAVRSVTWNEDGDCVSLGYWGVGDIIGYPLSKVNPYQLECITDVELSIIPFEMLSQNLDILFSHIQQTEILMSIVNCKLVPERVWQFLVWLGVKYGHDVEQGKEVRIDITHQEIADVLNTTRVTITRILNDLQLQGKLRRNKRRLILVLSQQIS